MPLTAGTRIGAYRIDAYLGGGRMGDVYKATDTRLDRVVALKLLAPELTCDESAKAQFVQETKAASALDHPNICTIHEIGETDEGPVYLAMSYYDGGTLKERIARGPLKIDDALDIAVQIAQGLADAHASGIIHRDIKPANVMFKGRVVKIVDFGVAKLAGYTGLTETGTGLGTASYMAPELFGEGCVDQRADLWSLGVVLYEMVIGQPPFKGDREMVVANAIQEQTPQPLTALRSDVPVGLERIAHRALAKKTNERYQTAADLLSELRWLSRGAEQRSTRVSWRKVAAASGVVVAASTAAFFLLTDARTSDTILRLTNPTQVTTALGVEAYPDWSPDGQTLVYAANPDSDLYGGNWDIWLTQVGGGASVNRTADHTGDDRYPSWSPDGQQIAFWSARDGGGYFVMSALGGASRRVSATPGGTALDLSPPQWSPDSTELASVTYQDGQAFLDVVTLRTNDSRRIPLTVQNKALDLSWSPDGRYVAYVDAVDLASQVTRLWLFQLSSGDAVELTDGRSKLWSPHWAPDGRTLYYVSNRTGSMDLWQLRLQSDGTADGEATRVTSGVGMIRAAQAADGSRVAYSRGRRVANVWRVPIVDDRRATWADAEQITFDEAAIEMLDVSPDGTRLVVSSDRAGNPDLWVLPTGGGEMQQLTTDITPDWSPAWSPDGGAIVFYAYRSGNRDIWVMPLGGGAPRQLTTDPADEQYPSWAPDGASVVYSNARGGIWTVPSQGGEPRQIVAGSTADLEPAWSPDGRRLVFTATRGGPRVVWHVSRDGGEPEPLGQIRADRPVWSRDGQEIFHLGLVDGTRHLWALPAEGGPERQLTELRGRRGVINNDALATDGEYLYFVWREDSADIWVMDVVQDDGSDD